MLQQEEPSLLTKSSAPHEPKSTRAVRNIVVAVLVTAVAAVGVIAGLDRYYYDPLIQAAQDSGYATGYDTGYMEGLDEGHGTGYRDGYFKGEENGYKKGFHENGAYHEGFQAGYENGLQEGQENGYQEGLYAGYHTGYDEGVTSGYRNGYDDGKAAVKDSYYDSGYNAGYSDGLADGQASDYSYQEPEPVGYTVYITATGSKYHRSGCSYLRKSSYAINVYDAQAKGYTPCSRCNP